MKLKIITTILSLLLAVEPVMGRTVVETVKNTFSERLQYSVRVGYNVGGNMPLGMPEEIRALNSYTPQMNPVVGGDALLPINDRWAGYIGLRFENKAMSEDAKVKNYHMEISKGGQTLAGMFTGDVTTKTCEWMLTLPIQAVLHWNKVDLRLGPYVSYLINREFSGWAHNGYLRVDDPTGAKVLLGEGPNERGDYDFSEHMCRWHFGIGLGADWHFGSRMGAYAELNWGMTPTMLGDFHTIEQKLFPIYGTLGLTYKLK